MRLRPAAFAAIVLGILATANASPQADAPQSDAPQTGGGTVILWAVAAVVVGTAVVVAVAVALRR